MKTIHKITLRYKNRIDKQNWIKDIKFISNSSHELVLHRVRSIASNEINLAVFASTSLLESIAKEIGAVNTGYEWVIYK